MKLKDEPGRTVVLEVTNEERIMLDKFFRPLGVELRSTAYDGETGMFTMQGRAPLLEYCKLWPQSPAEWALEHAQKDIERGNWGR